MSESNIKTEKPILSICIPTYNRCKYLKHTIDSIIGQKEFIDKRVEIVVSDNASTDETRELCEEYIQKYSNFYYNRNTENVHDENFPIVISEAHGTYRKIFNDNYICLDQTLEKICSLIYKYQNDKPLIIWEINQVQSSSQKSVEVDINFNELLYKLGERITNLVYFGMWDINCDNILEDMNYCNKKIWQAYKIMDMASKKDRIIYFKAKCIDYQNVVGKDVTYNIFDIFYNNYLDLLKLYVTAGKVSKSVYNDVRKNMLFDTFYQWGISWKDERLGWRFNDDENLPLEIQEAYKDEPYYFAYLLKIYTMKFLRSMKRLFVH